MTRHCSCLMRRCSCSNGTVPTREQIATWPLLCQPLAALGMRAPCAYHVNLGLVPDAQLVREYQSAMYVPALRKFEGFELAGVEALFSGARAWLPDAPPRCNIHIFARQRRRV